MPERSFMIVKLIQYIRGYVRIRITGYSPERFLNLCSHHQIRLWGLRPCGHAYEMYLSVKSFRKLKPILRKSNMRIKVLERRGLPFFLNRNRKRQAFFTGAILCLLLVYLMSLRIWNIHISGNYSHTDEGMLKFLASKDICHGMLKRKIDCEQIVKAIRSEYDDVIWVSASIQGTRLFVQMKENMDMIQEEPEEEIEAPADIISDADGIITEMITRKGVPQMEAGSEIKKGDLLVSGSVPVLDDNKEVTGYQYHIADADIYIQTEIPYESRMEIAYQKKVYTGQKRKALLLEAGPYAIQAGILFHRFPESETYVKKKTLRIGEHFDLPIRIGLKEIRAYTFSDAEYADSEIRRKMTEEFDRFCKELKKKGVQILENNVKIYKDHGNAVAKGTLTVIKTVGETVQAVKDTDHIKGEE